MIKRCFFVCVSVVFAVACFMLSGCGEAPSDEVDVDTATVPANVRVGYWGNISEAPLVIAYENGIFEKYGINAEMVEITTTGAITFTNETGYAIYEASPNFLPAIQNGLDSKCISSIHTGGIQACATADSGITSMKDLEGKAVGTYGTDDSSEIFLRAAMVNAGADPNKATFMEMGTIAAMFTGIKSDEVVAFCNIDPYVEIACQYLGYTKIFNCATDENFKDTVCCFLAGNSAVYNDSDIAGRCAMAVDEACRWISENPEETVRVMEGGNASGTQYVVSSAQLLAAFGIDISEFSDSNPYVDLVQSYTWGDSGEENFTASIKKQWEIIEKYGVMTGSQTVDELTSLVGSYAL